MGGYFSGVFRWLLGRLGSAETAPGGGVCGTVGLSPTVGGTVAMAARVNGTISLTSRVGGTPNLEAC